MTRGMIQSVTVAALVPIVLVPVLHWTGTWIWAGAHPFWSLRGGLIGLGIGLVAYSIAVLAGVRWPAAAKWFLLGFAALLALAGVTSLQGKQGFAASYAEDAFAGRLWYFGYIAAIAALSAGLATLLLIVLRSRSRG